jgi:hypothetical protein
LQRRVERKSVAMRWESLPEDEVVEVLRTGTIGIIEPDERPEVTGATQ